MASHPDFQRGTLPTANTVPHSQHSQQHHNHEPRHLHTNENHRVNNAAQSSASHPDQPDTEDDSASLVARPRLNNGKFTEEWDASQRGSSIIHGYSTNMQRSNSYSSNAGEDQLNLPSRGNTLKKKNSLRRNGSMKRSGSRRSMQAGSVRSLALQSTSDPDEAHSAFHCPVPTEGNPTEVLATRFQSWRKILKDLIAYYREIQSHYETKSKSLVKLANVANNISNPPGFLTSGGIDDAMEILRTYHKSSIVEANKAREIEEDVILALTGLRSDLHQKIKEIKSLSGDFKNSVQKEMDVTRKLVKSLQDTIGQSDVDPASTTGKQDPYLLRLAVDRQVERQMDEENYLHQAYLNLEASGRELESIVVGEIQKAYNAYAGILKRESDAAYTAIDELRIGPISMPKDREWTHFVRKDDHFVDPDIAVRSAEQIHYPGQDHVSAQEIRAGLLERKSKYLKSYTAGWYVLSSTHLHEFKSADKAQAPVMSLFLPEQKLGSHSSEGGSSNKFILKGRQTGSMHRGHTWVFRAETHDTMMAWYEDIKALTEKTPQERSEFVRGHSRSLSQSSRRSISSDGMVDEEDDEPFSAETMVDTETKQDIRRPQPGGRFPSDIQVNAQRGLQAPLSPSSMSSGFDSQAQDATNTGPGASASHGQSTNSSNAPASSPSPPDKVDRNGLDDLNNSASHAAIVHYQVEQDGVNPYTSHPVSQEEARQQTLESLDGQPSRNEPEFRDINSHSQGDLHGPGNLQGYRPQNPHGDESNTLNTFAAAPVTPDALSRTAPTNAETRDPQGNRVADTRLSVGPDPHVSYVTGHHPPGHDMDGAGLAELSGPPEVIASTSDHRGANVSAQLQPRSTLDTGPASTARRSDPTVSHLHIPGEYPKGTPTAESFENGIL
ncbi:PH domain-containing protein [Plectosphaerella plurivora]|uniref:PH domain-containing protein n=1 Tax=Plectosphaerella plurivora TaxID=936078 RepID=A0A9P8V3L2_9PEZI|nr:PH domain-containing protein [Plectosphaerella plurivora]